MNDRKNKKGIPFEDTFQNYEKEFIKIPKGHVP